MRSRGKLSPLLLAMFTGGLADDSFFYPPNNGEILYIPVGTPITINWTSSYQNLNLRVFQRHADGSFTFSTILSDVSNTPGPGSESWVTNVLDTSSWTGAMHFEITKSSNAQSLDPFNSGIFHVTNSSAISTSGAPSATMLSSTSRNAKPTSTPTSSSKHSSNSNNLKLGLGLGLGLGIPLLILISGVLIYFLRRKRLYGVVAPHWEDEKQKETTQAAQMAPATYYKADLREQMHELDGHRPVYEAPSDNAVG